MKNRCKSAAAFFLWAASWSYSFQDNVVQLIADSNYTQKSVGVVVWEVGTCSTLVSINADTFFNPASVMKCITAAAAFELLGMRYCFKTAVYTDGPLRRDSGIVTGNLYIRGGGDPGFLAERLWLFVQHLTHCGIKKITGDLVLDDSFFDAQVDGPGFGEDVSSRAYEAPVAALSANFNTIAIHVAPGAEAGMPVVVTPFPQIRGVKIICTAKTVPAGTPSNLEIKTDRVDGRTAIAVYGSMSLNEKGKYKYRKVWSTWENFGWAMLALFEQSGIEFNGAVKHAAIPDSLKTGEPFYTFESRPLPEFVFNMFKYSSNFAAEMVFKTIAAENDSLPGAWENGARIVGGWWRNGRILESGRNTCPVIQNGSGMGGGNRVTPQQIAALLNHVWKQKSYFPEFLSSLSTAGIDGTLETRFTGSCLKGIVRAKTGTLNDRGVSNLAGYVLLKDRWYVFVILVTNTKKSQFSHWTLQQKILETVFAEKVKKKGRR